MIEYLYIALIAIPIGLVAFNTGYWGGIYRCLCISEIVLAAMAFMVFQAGMFWLGSWLGGSFSLSIGWLSIPVSETIILLTGVKLIYSAIRTRPEQKSYDLGKYGELIAVSFASSLNAFMTGLGYGLLRTATDKTYAAIVLTTAVLTIGGVYLGKKNGKIVFIKISGILAGIILIILSIVLPLDLYNVIF